MKSRKVMTKNAKFSGARFNSAKPRTSNQKYSVEKNTKMVAAVEMPTQMRSLNVAATSFHTEACNHCGNQEKSVRRDFSEQASAALISWGEVQSDTIQKPICNHCYKEIRDILIERADEILQAPLSVIASSLMKKQNSAKRAARVS